MHCTALGKGEFPGVDIDAEIFGQFLQFLNHLLQAGKEEQVLFNGHILEQGRALRHQRQLSARLHPSGGGLQDRADEGEQRGFSAPVGTGQHDAFTGSGSKGKPPKEHFPPV